jgi:hypothetical protein
MTTSFQKHLVVGTLVASLAASATIVARATEWWIPLGARETSRTVRLDGVTEHRFVMPGGDLRIVAIGPVGATRRLVNMAQATE